MDREFQSRDGRRGTSRRALLCGGLALTFAGCTSNSLLPPGAEVAPPRPAARHRQDCKHCYGFSESV